MQWYLLLGILTGCRTMTPITVLCWFAWLGYFPPTPQGWAFWTAKLVSVVVFTALALGEYVGDVLPTTPSRKAPGPAIARLVFGALSGAVAAAAMQEPATGGAILGAIGAAIGTWGGWWLRNRVARAFGRDLPAGLLESVIVLALAITICGLLHGDSVRAAALESLLRL